MSLGTTLVEVRNPALEHIIERPRLIKLIEEADARIVLLCAPAGYGKTTLAKQWAARQTGPVAWYRTTRASGDVGALAVGLDKALAVATSPKEREPKRIESIASVNPKPAPLARTLISMYGDLGPDVLLVLDEWEAAADEEAEDLVARLIDELSIRCLVTSRSRPRWFTARLLAYGEGLEIGLSQLSMTNEEAVAVLGESDSAATQALVNTAGGWPVVLGLAALTETTDLSAPGRASRTLYEYFVGELLTSAPTSLQTAVTLLAAAAINSNVVAELVLGDETAMQLKAASARGMLATEAEGSIVMHPMLREFLVDQLRATDPQSRQDVARRLEPLIEHERWDEALAAAEAIRDPKFVDAALGRALPTLLRLHRVTTVRRWLDAGRIAGSRGAFLDYVESEVALRRGEFDRALVLASTASHHLGGDNLALAHIVAARAAHLGCRSSISESHLDRALSATRSQATRTVALWLSFAAGLETARDDLPNLLAAFEAASDGSIEHAVRVAHGRISLSYRMGGLPERLHDAGSILAIIDDDVDPMVASSFLNVYSNGSCDCGHFRIALETVEKELALADQFELDFVRSFALVNRAKALIGLRQFAQATRSLAELSKRGTIEPDAYSDTHHALSAASLYLSMGDVDRAYAAVAPHPDPLAGHLACAEYLALRALVLAAMHKPGADHCALEAMAYATTADVRATTRVAEAIARLNEGDSVKAAVALKDALASGFLASVVLGLRASPTLVDLAAGSPALKEALVQILHESNDRAIAKRIGIDLPRSVLRSRDLSPRELEIHGLMAQGMTNREIARLLFISESTTKVHVRHILEKLGVRSRTEAVRIWQEEIYAE